MTKNKFIRLAETPAFTREIKQRADKAGLSISDYIRESLRLTAEVEKYGRAEFIHQIMGDYFRNSENAPFRRREKMKKNLEPHFVFS